jgi:riboflavin synthase alpha subunit
MSGELVFEDISNDSLQFLLKTMQRKQTVDGKGQVQVEGIMLTIDKTGHCSALSLTRDLTGLTSVGGDVRHGY